MLLRYVMIISSYGAIKQPERAGGDASTHKPPVFLSALTFDALIEYVYEEARAPLDLTRTGLSCLVAQTVSSGSPRKNSPSLCLFFPRPSLPPPQPPSSWVL